MLQLPVDAQEGIRVALEMIDLLEMQTAQIDRDLPALAHCQPGCRALMDKIYAIGERSSLDTLCELGDVSRPCVTPGRQARRDRYRRSPLRSDRQAGEAHPPGLPGMPPELRWALYEAAQSACRKTSPDHADYQALKQRGLSHTRASLTIALKLARRSYPVLRELGPGGLDPIID